MKRPMKQFKKPNPYKSNKSELSLKKTNPFEVHVNRSKFTVLGQKSKNDRGLPGVSRAKANKNREGTLLSEYKSRLKTNIFNDRRIGENSASMDPEKKIMLRMTAEKKHQFSRKSKFNLNDDEELTHGGEALTDATMNDALSDIDDEDDDILDAKYVKAHHFGGSGFLTKGKQDSNEGDGENKSKEHKTRKEWIEEMIAESKKKKYDQKKEKDVQQEAVSKINEQYNEFLSLMAGKNLTDEDKEKSKNEDKFKDYDVLYRTLQVERCRKAPASDKLETAEEIAKKEKEKLEKLEEDRVRRMIGVEEQISKQDYSRSADALDDGFSLKKGFKDQVSYNEGALTSDSTIKEPRKKNQKGFSISNERNNEYENKKTSNDENDELDEEDDFAEDEAHESESDESDQYSDILEDEEGENELDDECSDGEDNNIGVDEEVEDEDQSDAEDVTNEESHGEDKSLIGMGKSENRLENEVKKKEVKGGILKKKSQARVKFLDRQKIMEEAKKEIPFTFEVPKVYEDFSQLLEGRSIADCSTILERMIACNHPRLGGFTKEKSTTLFNYLLQILHAVCSPDPDELCEDINPLSYVDIIIPHLYTLVQLSPKNMAESFVQVIGEKYKDYSEKNVKRYPHADTFIFLKVSGLLFPTSDAYHNVSTRVICFMAQILSESRVKKRRDVTALLFTTFLLLEFFKKSGRFLGEIMNVLKGMLYLCVPLSEAKVKLPHAPPFKRVGDESEILALKSRIKRYNPSQLSFSGLNDDLPIDDDFKVKAFNETLSLLDKFCKLWNTLSSVKNIFSPVLEILNEISLDNYPRQTRDLRDAFLKTFENLPSIGKHLSKEAKRPTALRMIEPRIEKIMYNDKKWEGTQADLETQKLMHMVKREKKAVKRELKRDSEFLAREIHKEERQSDAERKRKVNLIMSGLSSQEGEFKKMKKKKMK